MKSYLITGGAGFIGSNFIHYLVEKYGDSIEIINVDKLTYSGNLENIKDIEHKKNYKFYKEDICNADGIRQIFNSYEIDYIINFAAETHVDRSIKDSGVFVKTNILGVQTLLEIAKENWETKNGFKEGKRFIQISTDEVYGSLGEEGFFTEETALHPRNPYAASKAAGDLLVQSYFHTYGMSINITRCSNNYGPYQFPEKLIPLMIINILKGEKLPVYGDGMNIRDWLYVEDHCAAIDKVLREGEVGEIYNIGGHNEVNTLTMVKKIIVELSGLLALNDSRKKHISEELIIFVQDRKGHDKRYAIDPKKITNDLGWNPVTPFSEGIRSTIKWYIDHETWIYNVMNEEYRRFCKELYKEYQ